MTQLYLSQHDAALAEEQAAAKKTRDMERARRALQNARETDLANRIQALAAEQRLKHSRCRCNFRGVRTRAQLTAMGAGCTDPLHACPRLDAVRRAIGN